MTVRMLGLGLALVFAVSGAMAQEPRTLSVVDQRPVGEQRAWRHFTLSPFSCIFAVWQLSEDVGFGDRLGALREDLSQNLDPGIGEVTITRYDVFLNRAAADYANAVGVAAAAHGGYSSGAVVQSPRCSRERMSVGWFDPAEATSSHSPLIVEIDATANGQSFTARSAYFPTIDLPSTYYLPFRGRPRLREPEQQAAFRAAMARAHEVLAAEINASAASQNVQQSMQEQPPPKP